MCEKIITKFNLYIHESMISWIKKSKSNENGQRVLIRKQNIFFYISCQDSICILVIGAKKEVVI